MSLKQLSIKELAAISGGCEANCHHRMDVAKAETERQLPFGVLPIRLGSKRVPTFSLRGHCYPT